MGMVSHITHKEVVDSLYEASRQRLEAGDEPPVFDQKLVNMKMRTIVQPQDTFEALANELFGFPRSE